jgi:hypothetical protein
MVSRANWITAVLLVALAPVRAWASPPAPTIVPPPPQVVEVDPRNYKMVLAGDILIGLSGAGMVTLAIGLGTRADAKTQRSALAAADIVDEAAIARQAQRMQTGTALAIAGGVATAALLSSGITLVATGYRRERLRRMSLQAQLSPRYTGLTWTLRF